LEGYCFIIIKLNDFIISTQQIPYTITHTYTAAINGVAMRLPASAIQALLQSAEIEAIYANKEIKMIPPVQPSY